MKAQAKPDDLATIRDRVRTAGLRCTSARLAVMRELAKAGAPVSHAEVADNLASLGLDKATVFRNLNDLADAGLVIRSELGDHVWRFEIRDPDAADGGQHPHFMCVDCGGVTCLSDVEFDPATRKKAAQIGVVTEILLKGRCKKCV
jgi:Fur family ferric uptake transcriptional regulator